MIFRYARSTHDCFGILSYQCRDHIHTVEVLKLVLILGLRSLLCVQTKYKLPYCNRRQHLHTTKFKSVSRQMPSVSSSNSIYLLRCHRGAIGVNYKVYHAGLQSGGGGHAEAHLNLTALDCFDLPCDSLNSVPTYIRAVQNASVWDIYS